jgi:SAM-dependent methyltransferase
MVEKIKKILPQNLVIYLNKIRFKILHRRFKNFDNKKIFTEIYRNKLWNKDSKLFFDSGTGSHEDYIVSQYVGKINNFLLNKNLSVVDIGCGDFNIASKFYLNCKKYYGIDVVEDLIKHLNKTYSNVKSEFICLDASMEKFPEADCVIIKEVLQHLTNYDIKLLLSNIKYFKYVIITESYPFKINKINVDKIKGPLSRSYNYSAVEIDKPPFNFPHRKKTEILSIEREGIGFIKTFLYEC